MSFFMDPSVTVGTKILELFYIFMGFMSVYAGVRNLLDKTNKARYGTFVFWAALGIVIDSGHCGRCAHYHHGHSRHLPPSA